jgi:hypothetical protein
MGMPFPDNFFDIAIMNIQISGGDSKRTSRRPEITKNQAMGGPDGDPDGFSATLLHRA